MRINIIGRGTGWEEGYEAPGEHWGINYFHPKADIMFEIHAPSHPFHEKLKHERANARAWGGKTVFHEDMFFVETQLYFGTDYFGSSTDWLIAYALKEYDPTEIHLYGVTMDDKGDHYEKRCCTDFWCGMAMGRDVDVVVHGNSTVMTTADGLSYGTFEPMQRRYELT